MTRFASIALACSMALSAPLVVGCDREVKREEKTITHSDGTQTHEEKTVKETPNGDIVKESHKSVDTNTRNP